MVKVFYFFVIILFSSSFVYAENYYNIGLDNSNGLQFKNFSLEFGDLDKEVLFGNYLLRVYSFDSDILYETNFLTYGNSIVEGDLGNGYFESEIVFYNFSEIVLQVPYFENAKRILIYNEFMKDILDIDVSFYSKNYEEFENLIDKNYSDEDGVVVEKNHKESLEGKDLSRSFGVEGFLLLGIFILLLVFLFFSLMKKFRS